MSRHSFQIATCSHELVAHSNKRYYILLALVEGSLHGYGIHEQILRDSRSTLYLRNSSLYDMLRDLEKRGCIEVAGEVPGLGGREGVRKLYRLTRHGRRVLKADAHTRNRTGA